MRLRLRPSGRMLLTDVVADISEARGALFKVVSTAIPSLALAVLPEPGLVALAATPEPWLLALAVKPKPDPRG